MEREAEGGEDRSQGGRRRPGRRRPGRRRPGRRPAGRAAVPARGTVRGTARRPAGGRTGSAALLLALAALAGAVPLRAQEGEEPEPGQEPRIDTPYRWIERGFRAGFVAGWMAANEGDLNMGPGESPVVGGRLRARISSPISLEFGGVLGFDSQRDVIDPRLPDGPGKVDEVDSTWLLVEAGMQFSLTGNRTWHGIQPYAVVGAGFLVGIDEPVSPLLSDPSEEDLRFDIEVAPGVQGGFGLEYLLNERFGLSLELRDHLWRLTTPEGFFDPEILERIEELGADAPQDTDWTNNLEINITLWRYF